MNMIDGKVNINVCGKYNRKNKNSNKQHLNRNF